MGHWNAMNNRSNCFIRKYEGNNFFGAFKKRIALSSYIQLNLPRLSQKKCVSGNFFRLIEKLSSEIGCILTARYIHSGIDHLRLPLEAILHRFLILYFTSIRAGHLGNPQSLRLKHIRKLYGFQENA